MHRTLRAIRAEQAAPRLDELFQRAWPEYRRWDLRDGESARPSGEECRAALRRYMPALVPTWERVVDDVGGDELAARFLSLWCPRPFMTGCSQAAWTRTGSPFLVRNYDYHPALWDAVLLWTVWNGRRVIAMADCLWGVLDGMNDAGLVVALSFGGRRVVGNGFGLPIILRYVLEFCTTTAEATEVLCNVPSHMAYNVTVLDAGGDARTVRVGPDRVAEVLVQPHSTNHQGIPDWEEYARATRTLERDALLAERLADPAETADRFIDRFLEPPLLVREFVWGWGTLYTTVYRPAEGRVELLWPAQSLTCSIADFRESEIELHFPMQ